MHKKKSFPFFAGLIAALIFHITALAQELPDIQAAIKAKGQKWIAGETSMSVLTDHEKKLHLGLFKTKVTGKEKVLSLQEPLTGLAPSVDWSAYVTPVRNQGNCGSCWAFAVTAGLESQMLIKGDVPGVEDNRAEQILVSCSGAGSCAGGYISSASNFAASPGLPPEAYFPYTAADTSCANAQAGWQDYTENIGSWSYVTTSPPNLTAIKTALAAGPLVTTMDVYYDFFNYRGGVYEYATGSYQGGHAILIVGYTDDSSRADGGYFKVKNSWGTGWGSGGFFYIGYSQLGSPVYFGKFTISYSTPDLPPAPAAPGSLSAVAISRSQINLTWTDHSTNEDGFKIERCTGSGCSNFAQIGTAPAGAAAFSSTGLAANTSYSYRVRAYNAGGDSGYSNTSSAATLTPQIPSAPSNLGATAASTTQINLAWTDTSSNEDGFSIERCTGAGCSNFTAVATAGANATSYSNTGLASGTSYSYRIRAYNAGGNSAYSNTASATTVCTCTLSPTSKSFAAAGGTGSVKVTTGANCSWTATGGASWIAGIPASGTGSGTLTYTVSKNTGARRTATINVLGKTHSVTQARK